MQAVASLQKNPLPVLTPRQKQIAYLVSLGLTRKAIAEEMFLSEGSIALHLSDLFFLLEVNNSYQLAALINQSPELLYVAAKPPLCKIAPPALLPEGGFGQAWRRFKQQRLKAALVLADVIERTGDLSLKRDLNEVLGILQPEERKNENLLREKQTTLRSLLLKTPNKNPQR